jgi:tellurite methyltransferase
MSGRGFRGQSNERGMVGGTSNLGWEWIWREHGERWELQPPQQEVVALAQRLKAEGKRTVHDLGCGLGRHLLLLAAEGFEVSGSDLSPQAVAACRRRLRDAGLSAEVSRSDMAEIPVEEGSLDCVVAWHVVYHATVEDMLRTLRGIHDKLRPGGYLLATFISQSNNSYEVSRREVREGLAQELEPDTFIRPRDEVGDKRLVHHYATEEEIRERLLSGFEVLSLEGERAPFDDPTAKPRRSTHWVALARKR